MFGLGKRVKSKLNPKISVSPIEYAIMAHLRRREILKKEQLGQYGNELIKELNKLFEGTWIAQSGTIYPILTKMDDPSDKDLLQSENKKTELGPVKKIYRLTDNGRMVIDQLLFENYRTELEFMERYKEFLKPIEQFFKVNKPQIISSTEDAKICPNCGEILEKRARFCSICGEKIEK